MLGSVGWQSHNKIINYFRSRSFFLKIKKITYVTAEAREQRANLTIKLMMNWKPDIVFVANDAAFDLVAIAYNQMYLSNSSLPPLIFFACGCTFNISSLSPSLLEKMSGVCAPEPFSSQVATSLVLNPTATKIAFIFDNSIKSSNLIPQLQQQIDSKSLRTNLSVEIYHTICYSQFQNTLSLLNNSVTDAYAIIVISSRELLTSPGATTVVSPQITYQWVQDNVPTCVIGPIEEGFTLDVRTSPNVTCSFAGLYAGQFLSGSPSFYFKSTLDSYAIENAISKIKLQSLTSASSNATIFKDPAFVASNTTKVFNPTAYNLNIKKISIVASYSQDDPSECGQYEGILTGLSYLGLNTFVVLEATNTGSLKTVALEEAPVRLCSLL